MNDAGCCDVVSVFAHLSKLYSPRNQEHGRFVHIVKYVTTYTYSFVYFCQDKLEQLTTWFMKGSYKNIW